mmetsp:Transcript_10270/g.29208  ORF Transcript_10270/g.29208 Transcript_10270/m.29208 type:complete len:282 (-) Transcript_10270:381-1226(-)
MCVQRADEGRPRLLRRDWHARSATSEPHGLHHGPGHSWQRQVSRGRVLAALRSEPEAGGRCCGGDAPPSRAEGPHRAARVPARADEGLREAAGLAAHQVRRAVQAAVGARRQAAVDVVHEGQARHRRRCADLHRQGPHSRPHLHGHRQQGRHRAIALLLHAHDGDLHRRHEGHAQANRRATGHEDGDVGGAVQRVGLHHPFFRHQLGAGRHGEHHFHGDPLRLELSAVADVLAALVLDDDALPHHGLHVPHAVGRGEGCEHGVRDGAAVFHALLVVQRLHR